jgi:cell division septation protein DedD
MVHLYLQQLLDNRKQVIVPELGQFTLIETPSTFDAQSGQFHPATRTIIFDESKRFEPSDFVNWVAEAENTSVDSVLHAVRSLIYDLRKNITEVGEYHLKGLGNFLIDDRFNLTFVQSDEPNFDSFGLPDLDIIAIDRDEEPTVTPELTSEQANIEPEYSINTEEQSTSLGNLIDLPIPSIFEEGQILESAPIEEISESEEPIAEVLEFNPTPLHTIAEPEELIAPSDEEEELTIASVSEIETEATLAPSITEEEENEDAKDPTLTWPVIMLMVLVVVISGFGIYYYMNYINPAADTLVLHSDTTKVDSNATIKENNNSSAATTTNNEPIAANTAPSPEQPVVEPKPEPVPTPKPEAPKPEPKAEVVQPTKKEPELVQPKVEPKPTTKAASTGTFKVVAGAFGVEENAKKLEAFAKSKGYNAEIIPISGSKVKFKVAIGSFPSEAEAKALKEKAQTDFTESLLIMK